ncbi:MAG: HNH endonuclease [Proteobacteria bacterium]|nr:HNH endonuclease [Pseudomonadota bacterium]MBU2226671.1 HNH endonuclease [Pseudomonadota bacterium]MBU2261068.1 HNH endonuclease [Pseudomonadota bacterium]
MAKNDFPREFLKKCKAVTAKRPRTVINHILKHGHITTEELKEKYGYNHPPRAARDVKEQGIPLEMFRVVGSDGRKIGAYKFGDPAKAKFSKLSGRTAFAKELKAKLIELHGCRCFIYLEEFEERSLQIDHRVPFEVAGDDNASMDDPKGYMLLCGSANRAKSWSCEHCVNWCEIKKRGFCRRCYWAYPEDYDHVAMRQARRVDIMWTGAEISVYDRLRRRTMELQKDIPQYIKEIIEKHI